MSGEARPPADIEAVVVADADDECVHRWSRWGIPACERCFEDRRNRERFTQAMRRGGPHRIFLVRLAALDPSPPAKETKP